MSVTLQDILSEFQIPFAESGKHSRQGWIQIETCPFCGSNSHHLGVSIETLGCSCWKCGKQSLYEVFIHNQISPAKAFQAIKSLRGGSTTMVREAPRTGLVEPKERGPLLGAHKRYLKGRGFDWRALVGTWKIEGIGLHPRLSWRIYIPVTEKNRRVSWTTRSIAKEADQRYISASADEESVNHKHTIYGADMCHQSIVVVEGPTDAWRVGPGAGCLFGTAFTEEQVLKLSAFPYRYICFDDEPVAQKRAAELATQLSCFPGVTHNVVLDAEDPGSASEKEIRKLRRFANL